MKFDQERRDFLGRFVLHPVAGVRNDMALGIRPRFLDQIDARLDRRHREAVLLSPDDLQWTGKGPEILRKPFLMTDPATVEAQARHIGAMESNNGLVGRGHA